MLKYALHGQPIVNVEAAIYTQQASQRLIGKKILITGGGGGLGKAMAKRFVEEGAEVVITGRNKEKTKDAAIEIGCKYLVADLQDTETLSNLIRESVKLLNGLNVLVNNAGVSLHEWEIEKVTLEGWNQQFDTNLRAPYFLTKYFIKHLTENSIDGNILFVSSERSQTVDIIPYGLTKAAMNSLVQGLAKKIYKQRNPRKRCCPRSNGIRHDWFQKRLKSILPLQSNRESIYPRRGSRSLYISHFRLFKLSLRTNTCLQ